MTEDVRDKRSTIEWLRDEIPQGRQSVPDPSPDSHRSSRVPAGLRVMLTLSPVIAFLLVFFVLFMSRSNEFSGLSGATSLPPRLSEADRELLHKHPELFLVKNSSYTLENGTILYSIRPDVMQMWVGEIRESQRVYVLLSTLFLILVVLLSLRLVVVVVWCLFALLDRPCPRWLDVLV